MTFSDKLHLLWTIDSEFSGNIVGMAAAIIAYVVVIYIFGINFLYVILPGGKVYGDSSTTSFPRWLPMACLLLITLFYTIYKIDNTAFILSAYGEYICEYKTRLVPVIDKWFGWGSLLITYAISFVYALWFRE